MWWAVTLAALALVLIQTMYERITGERKRLAEIQKKVKAGVSEEELQEHLVTLNKIMLRRMVVFLILFFPLIYALNGLGTIETPAGQMPAVWWFALSSIVIGLLVGGVQAWIRRRGA